MTIKVCVVCQKVCDCATEMVPYRNKCKICYGKEQQIRYLNSKDKIREQYLKKRTEKGKTISSNAQKINALEKEVERLNNVLNQMIANSITLPLV